jgi:hypothetical protein
VDRVDILLWIRGRSARAFAAVRFHSGQGNCLGAVAVRKANYGCFVFTLPLELPSSSYYQAEVRCSDAGDVVGMSPVFSVAHDQQVRAAAADTAGLTTFALHAQCLSC